MQFYLTSLRGKEHFNLTNSQDPEQFFFWPLGAAWKKSQEPDSLKKLPAPQPWFKLSRSRSLLYKSAIRSGQRTRRDLCASKSTNITVLFLKKKFVHYFMHSWIRIFFFLQYGSEDPGSYRKRVRNTDSNIISNKGKINYLLRTLGCHNFYAISSFIRHMQI